jgi:hypothetical protein
MFRLVLEPERLTALRLPSVVKVLGVWSVCTYENKAAGDVQHSSFLPKIRSLGCSA